MVVSSFENDKFSGAPWNRPLPVIVNGQPNPVATEQIKSRRDEADEIRRHVDKIDGRADLPENNGDVSVFHIG